MSAATDPSWHLYPETILELHAPTGLVRVDLRQPVEPAVANRLALWGPCESFAVVTSDNPEGRERDTILNENGRAQLARVFSSRGEFHLRADGMSPDGAHREHGYAAWIDIAEARERMLLLRQSAFFWFDGVAFRIEGALANSPARPLPID